MANSYKGKYAIEAALKFRDLVHRHGGRQADVVLEKNLRVLHLNPQPAGRDSVILDLA